MAFYDKQVFLGGVAAANAAGLATAQLQTTADLTLDVNVATGNDTTGDGSAAKPFASIMRAMNTVAHLVANLITIRVFAGTYAETIFDGHVYMGNGLFTARIEIVGQDWTTPVLGSGSITSGTLGSAPSVGITRTVAGAAWNVNELKGYFARITSGAQSGNYFPIAANAAGDLDIPNTNANLNGATFDIVQQAAVVTRGSGLFGSAIVQNAGAIFGNNALVLRRMRFNSGSSYGVYAGSGGCQVSECHISGHTFTGINIGNGGTYCTVSRSFIQNSGSLSAISGSEVMNFFAGGTVLDGGARGIQFFTVTRTGCNASGHLVIQNTTAQAIDIKSGPMLCDTYSTQKYILRGNAVGIRMQGNSRFLLQNAEIIGNSSHGIQMLANEYSTSHCSLHAFACKIQNNGGDGIRVESPHNNIMFGIGGDISGNTGYGIRVGGQPASYVPASHTSLNVDASCTMGTNTAGDITIDNGVTSSTIAAARSAGFLLDSNLFNRFNAPP